MLAAHGPCLSLGLALWVPTSLTVRRLPRHAALPFQPLEIIGAFLRVQWVRCFLLTLPLVALAIGLEALTQSLGLSPSESLLRYGVGLGAGLALGTALLQPVLLHARFLWPMNQARGCLSLALAVVFFLLVPFHLFLCVSLCTRPLQDAYQLWLAVDVLVLLTPVWLWRWRWRTGRSDLVETAAESV